jgi:hypothetical protein
MKWLKKIVYKWSQEGKRHYHENENDRVIGSLSTNLAVPSRNFNSNRDGMSFTVHKAAGGHIVKFQTYNERTDNTEESLHIINDTEDFSDSLGKIVFMECLRK